MASYPDTRTRPLYLVRHGQSEWNAARLTQGQTSHPRLTALGRAQARDAAQLIAADAAALGISVHRITTSDLVRAVETANIIGIELGAEIGADIRLREQRLGILEGRSYDATRAAMSDPDRWGPSGRIVGGESLLDVHCRMADAIASLDRSVVTVLVSHGDAIRAALASLTGVAAHEAPWVDVPNGAVARVDVFIDWLS